MRSCPGAGAFSEAPVLTWLSATRSRVLKGGGADEQPSCCPRCYRAVGYMLVAEVISVVTMVRASRGSVRGECAWRVCVLALHLGRRCHHRRDHRRVSIVPCSLVPGTRATVRMCTSCTRPASVRVCAPHRPDLTASARGAANGLDYVHCNNTAAGSSSRVYIQCHFET